MKFNILLDEQQLNLLSDALIELPYKTVAQLILDINIQIQEQMKNTSDGEIMEHKS